MRTLTEEEVLDFISELQQRPTMWYGKDRLWVRKQQGENAFALKFVNGLPDDMSTLYVRVLREQESQESVERYVDWLLSKFTSYAWRMQVESYLRHKLFSWDEGSDDKLAQMAREICAQSSSTRSPEAPVGRECSPPAGLEPDVRVGDLDTTVLPSVRIATTTATTQAAQIPKRSAYLEKLLRSKK